LNCTRIASDVNNVVQTTASTQSDHYLLVETCSRWIKDGDYSVTPICIAYLFHFILRSTQVDLIGLRVFLSILHCLNTNLYSYYFNIRNLFLDRYANSANATAQIQDDIAILHCFDNVRIENLAHVNMNLQKCCWRYLIDMVKNSFLIIGGAEKTFGFYRRYAVSFS
jgi:hypothetical protein